MAVTIGQTNPSVINYTLYEKLWYKAPHDYGNLELQNVKADNSNFGSSFGYWPAESSQEISDQTDGGHT